MPWVVGIDEAGYGPNLGPLVQGAVAVNLPAADPAGWDTLRPHVRRAGEKGPKTDPRPVVDDSKLVNVGKYGFAKLERGVAAVLGVPPGPLSAWLTTVTTPDVLLDLAAEAWFDGTEAIPLHPDPVPDARPALLAAGADAVIAGVRLVPAPLFNKIVAGSGSKATVLTAGLCGLLATLRTVLPADEPLLVVCDKHGGRNCYAAVLEAAFPDGCVVTEAEAMDESRYRVGGTGHDIRVVFRPGADAGSVSVALASMACKYLREVCMRQFNRFWARHVPGLKPTAGYPTDAKRYYDAIRPAMELLGLEADAVWRVR